MRAVVFAIFMVFITAIPSAGAPARLDAMAARIAGGLDVSIGLDARVAYRVRPLSGPDRLAIDIASDFVADPALELPDGVDAVASRPLADGWHRIELRLARPVLLAEASFQPAGERLALRLRFRAATTEQFRSAAGTGGDGGERRLTVVLDPGHGGVDPGAVREGVAEKTVALDFALELAAQLRRTGRYDVVLTRDRDVFLTLAQRVRMARAAGGGLFISLHANTVTRGDASGAVVYVRSDTATDPESAARAALENSADLRGGLSSEELEDDVAAALLDLAAPVTRQRSRMAAGILVAELGAASGVIASRPLRAADFRVLSAPDIPSLLVEIGFISNPVDRMKMTSPEWRRQTAAAIARSVDRWQAEDAALLALMRR